MDKSTIHDTFIHLTNVAIQKKAEGYGDVFFSLTTQLIQVCAMPHTDASPLPLSISIVTILQKAVNGRWTNLGHIS